MGQTEWQMDNKIKLLDINFIPIGWHCAATRKVNNNSSSTTTTQHGCKCVYTHNTLAVWTPLSVANNDGVVSNANPQHTANGVDNRQAGRLASCPDGCCAAVLGQRLVWSVGLSSRLPLVIVNGRELSIIS